VVLDIVVWYAGKWCVRTKLLKPSLIVATAYVKSRSTDLDPGDTMQPDPFIDIGPPERPDPDESMSDYLHVVPSPYPHPTLYEPTRSYGYDNFPIQTKEFTVRSDTLWPGAVLPENAEQMQGTMRGFFRPSEEGFQERIATDYPHIAELAAAEELGPLWDVIQMEVRQKEERMFTAGFAIGVVSVGAALLLTNYFGRGG
jgi:hypothetical protein